MKISPSSFAFTVLVASLAALPPLSTDLMLSALPVIGVSLHASPATAGYAISFFFIGFAAAQLIFGPCSDRYGRLPIGRLGCLLFAVAGLGCTFAGSITVLLVWRVLQGIGAGACAVLAFAIVRDSFSGPAARVRFAYVNACMAFAPMVAPMLGSFIFELWGWRAIFGLLAGAGIVLLAALSLWFSETLAPPNRLSLSPRALARSYWTVLSHRAVLAYCLLGTLTFGAMMCYVTSSPFIFIEILGMRRSQFGLMFFGTASGIMLGSSLAGWLVHRFHLTGRTILTGSLLLGFLSTLVLLALGLAHVFTPAHAIPLLMLATFSAGLTAPTTAHGVLAPMGERAGTAAAVMGGLRMVGGAAAAAVVAAGCAGTPTAMAAVMSGFMLLAVLVVMVLPAERGARASRAGGYRGSAGTA